MNVTILTMGSRGDVQPCIAIGQGLLRAGFRVKLAAPSDYGPLVSRHGLSCHPVSHSLRQLYKADPGSRRLRENLESTRLLFRHQKTVMPVVDRILEELWQASQGADVILFSPLTLAGYHMAAILRIPAFLICFQPLARTGEFPNIMVPSGVSGGRWLNYGSHLVAEQLLWRFFQPAVARWQGRVSQEPVPLRGCFSQFYAGKVPIFHGYSDAVVPRPGDWGRHVHVTGYWFLDEEVRPWRPGEHLLAFLDSGEPPVGLDFGSMNDRRVALRARACVTALLRAGWRVLVLRGGSGLDTADIPDSDHVMITDSLPHDWLLPRLAMLVHHGGSGTTAAALRAGIPSLIMPFFFDQFFWARRLYRLGVGPPPIRHARQLAPAAKAVARDRAMHHRLDAISGRVRAERGVDNLVQAFSRELSASA